MFTTSRFAAGLPCAVFSTRRFFTVLCCLGHLLAARPLAHAAPLISEFVANNHPTLADKDDEYPGLADFASSLPVLALDTHGTGAINLSEPNRAVWFDLFAPAGGSGTFAATPLVSASATTQVRGASTALFPKKSYSFTLLDGSGRPDSRA